MLNEEEKQAIERMKRDYELAKSEDAIDIDIFTEDIKIVLNLLEKKDKIIDEMATLVFMSRNLTFVDEEQFSARKREIVEYAEEQATAKGAI